MIVIYSHQSAKGVVTLHPNRLAASAAGTGAVERHEIDIVAQDGVIFFGDQVAEEG